jgi:hypothetical protein
VPGLTPADVLGAPYALIGTVDEVIEELDRHRERWDFTSYVIAPTRRTLARCARSSWVTAVAARSCRGDRDAVAPVEFECARGIHGQAVERHGKACPSKGTAGDEFGMVEERRRPRTHHRRASCCERPQRR